MDYETSRTRASNRLRSPRCPLTALWARDCAVWPGPHGQVQLPRGSGDGAAGARVARPYEIQLRGDRTARRLARCDGVDEIRLREAIRCCPVSAGAGRSSPAPQRARPVADDARVLLTGGGAARRRASGDSPLARLVVAVLFASITRATLSTASRWAAEAAHPELRPTRSTASPCAVSQRPICRPWPSSRGGSPTSSASSSSSARRRLGCVRTTSHREIRALIEERCRCGCAAKVVLYRPRFRFATAPSSRS